MWKRQHKQQQADDLHPDVDPRTVPAAMDAAFEEAIRDLENEWRGKPEKEVRVALQARLDRIGQPVSEPEIDLLTLQIVDPDWAAKDPERLQEILNRLDEIASASPTPPHFGSSHPIKRDGALRRNGWSSRQYQSAEVPADDDGEESYEVSGTTIRFMPEDSVTVPLWDEEGLLPEDPEWLNRSLGLTRELVADIAAWGEKWNATQRGQRFTAEQHREHQIRLDAEARLLVERLGTELPRKFTVVYRP